MFTVLWELNIWIKVRLSMVLKWLQIKISLWGQQTIYVYVSMCVRAFPFNFGIIRGKDLACHWSLWCPLILRLLMDFGRHCIIILKTFNPFIIFSRCTIIIIIIMTTVIYINFLLLQPGLSENMFSSSARNCLLVLRLFKVCLFEPFKERLCCIRN